MVVAHIYLYWYDPSGSTFDSWLKIGIGSVVGAPCGALNTYPMQSNSKTDVSFIWYQSEKSENEKTKLTKVIAFFPHNFDITTWMTAKVPALLIWNNFSDNVLIHLLFLCFNIKSMRKSAYLNNSNFWIVLVFEYYFAFSMLYSFVLNSYLVSVCSWNFVRFFFCFFFLD